MDITIGTKYVHLLAGWFSYLWLMK